MANILDWLSSLFVFTIGIVAFVLVVLFIIDRTQTQDAVRHNYPVIGRLRYVFTELGEFFRQYFFAMDREEMPFNRAQRDWVNEASTGKSTNVAFGSTRNLEPVGTPIFVNVLGQHWRGTQLNRALCASERVPPGRLMTRPRSSISLV